MTGPLARSLRAAAERRREDTQAVLSDLARAKAAFQQRAILAAIDAAGEARAAQLQQPRREDDALVRLTRGKDDE